MALQATMGACCWLSVSRHGLELRATAEKAHLAAIRSDPQLPQTDRPQYGRRCQVESGYVRGQGLHFSPDIRIRWGVGVVPEEHSHEGSFQPSLQPSKFVNVEE